MRPLLIKDGSVRGIGLRDRKKELMRVFGAPTERGWGERLVPESYPAKIGSIAVSAEPFPSGCEKGGFAPRSTVGRCMREALTGGTTLSPPGR